MSFAPVVFSIKFARMLMRYLTGLWTGGYLPQRLGECSLFSTYQGQARISLLQEATKLQNDPVQRVRKHKKEGKKYFPSIKK